MKIRAENVLRENVEGQARGRNILASIQAENCKVECKIISLTGSFLYPYKSSATLDFRGGRVTVA